MAFPSSWFKQSLLLHVSLVLVHSACGRPFRTCAYALFLVSTRYLELYSSHGRGNRSKTLFLDRHVTMTSPTHFHLSAYNYHDLEGHRPVDDGLSASNSRSAIQSNDVKRPSGLPAILSLTQSSKENNKLSELSQQIQAAHPPLFIPRFENLRKKCLEQTQLELQAIERELQHHVNSNSAIRSEKVAIAVRLLQQLGQ